MEMAKQGKKRLLAAVLFSLLILLPLRFYRWMVGFTGGFLLGRAYVSTYQLARRVYSIYFLKKLIFVLKT